MKQTKPRKSRCSGDIGGEGGGPAGRARPLVSRRARPLRRPDVDADDGPGSEMDADADVAMRRPRRGRIAW